MSMGPKIHIEREGAGGLRAWIPLDEWCEAVRLTEGVRLALDQDPRRNPETGKAISFGELAGEAEVYFPEEDAWRRCFRWDPAGYIVIADEPAGLARSWPARDLALRLAHRLRAIVIDEDGEIYD